MRRINIKASQLSSLPAGTFLEVFQDGRNHLNVKPQYVGVEELQASPLADPGAGISDGVGGSVFSGVEQVGDFKKTTVFVDLTGLYSSTTDLDIIGAYSSELQVNGGFATDTAWTGTDWSIAAGVASLDGTQAAETGFVNASSSAAVIGSTYEVQFTVSSFVAGTVKFEVGGVAGTARGANGTFTERVVATTADKLTLIGDAAANLAVDDVTLVEVRPAFLFRFQESISGGLFQGWVTCLETPATGVADIDMYSAAEATGKFDEAVSGLTETILRTNGGLWSGDVNAKIPLTALPADGEYIYLTCGAAGTPETYSAGQFVFEFWGV